MQPVTIRNKDLTNTLWIPQIILIVLTPVLLWLAFNIHFWYSVPLCVVLLVLSINHQTVVAQSKLKLTMHSSGKLTVTNDHDEKTTVKNNSKINTLDINDGDEVLVKALWYVPQVLMLKLTFSGKNKPIYLTLFRPVVGPVDFSLLLVGLTQLNHSLNTGHRNHVNNR